MQDLPSYWPDNNEEDGKQGRRNGSLSGWVSLQGCGWVLHKEFVMWSEVVLLEDECVCVSEADETRSKCLFQSRQTFTFHTLQNKSNPAPQIHRNFSQSLLRHRVLSLHRGVQTQCANVVRNAEPSESNLTKNNTINKDFFFLQSLKLPRPPIHCKKFFTWNLTLQDWTEMNQFMCHKTNGRED